MGPAECGEAEFSQQSAGEQLLHRYIACAVMHYNSCYTL